MQRPKEVRVKYRGINGEKREIVTDSFVAIVLQHELDHLFGKLYVDRIKDISKFVYEDQMQKES